MPYTDPVRTSQETHHVSATELNRLILFGETVEERRLLDSYAV
jgi:hypothetical protein